MLGYEGIRELWGTKVLDPGYEGIRELWGTKVLDPGYEGIRELWGTKVLGAYQSTGSGPTLVHHPHPSDIHTLVP